MRRLGWRRVVLHHPGSASTTRLYLKWQTRHLHADEIAIGMAVTFIGAFVTRMAVIYFGIGSPRFSSRS